MGLEAQEEPQTYSHVLAELRLVLAVKQWTYQVLYKISNDDWWHWL